MNEEMMDVALFKAQTLVEALPYIRKFNRKIVVIKYGGSAMKSDDLKNSVIEDATLLKLVGFKPILVHGGGKEISEWVEKTGGESRFVNGFRVTDKHTMTVAEMVLNRINKELVARIESLGVKAAGISGKDGGLLRVTKKMPDGQDIGYVGDVEKVDAEILFDLLEKDFLPVVCPVGMDSSYESYNVNADDAACAIAKAVNADKLVFLTDIGGLYRDVNDESTKISRLTISEADKLIESGMVGGGMLPKLSNCTEAVRGGVNRVHILDGRVPHCLLLEIFTDHGVGTMFFQDDEL